MKLNTRYGLSSLGCSLLIKLEREYTGKREMSVLIQVLRTEKKLLFVVQVLRVTTELVAIGEHESRLRLDYRLIFWGLCSGWLRWGISMNSGEIGRHDKGESQNPNE